MAKTTASVLDHHLQRFGAGDLKGTLEDYADSSVIIAPDGTVLRGLGQIRAFFEVVFAEFAKPGVSFHMTRKVVEGEVAYISWTAETAGNVYELGTDTFLIRGGRIAAQTVAFKVTPKR